MPTAVATTRRSSGGGMQQTVTIINNSGKIISTGKQLVSLFKEVSNTYKEKKADLKLQRFLQRSATDAPPRTRDYQEQEHDGDDRRSRRTFDEQSVASSRRSHRSRHSHSSHASQHRRRSTGQALTEDNLERLSEVSSTPPSQYRAPYAETVPAAEPAQPQQMVPLHHQPIAEESSEDDDDDDMHLAYGSVPPDLALREDLAPADPVDEVAQAQSLVHKIEDLLDEVECMEHTATAMIKHLQERPDAAAAVALTLAELSAFVGKLSPAFLSVLKGGSPAVFALLASPQFLIGTGIAVGVTVVMFGGWKIVQRAQQQQQQQQQQQAQQALAFEAAPRGPAPAAARSQASNGIDEALVLQAMEEELSTIETWRRGILPDARWERETAEMELITPRAVKTRRTHDDDDTRSHRSSRTHKSHKSSSSRRKEDDEKSVASKTSSRRKEDDEKSVASSASSRSKGAGKKTNMLKAMFKTKDKHVEPIYAS